MAQFVPGCRAANQLPFILASPIVVISATDMSDDPPQSVFENFWCLWDSGAQTSFVFTSQLDATVRNNQTEGNSIMDIKCDRFIIRVLMQHSLMIYISFSNVNQTIGSVIHFRPQLPNGVRFIILGQHVSLLSVSYSIQNVGNQFTTLVIHKLFSIVSSIRSSPCRSTLSCYNNSHRRTVKLSEPSTSVFSRFGACAKDLQPGYTLPPKLNINLNQNP